MDNLNLLTEIFGQNDFYAGSLRSRVKNKEITKHKKEILELADLAEEVSRKAQQFLQQNA